MSIRANLSRDELFRNSVEYFMKSNPKYDEVEYILKCKTKNLRKITHEYEIQFPAKKQIGVIDYSGGVLINDPIYMTQVLPTNTTIMKDIYEYFDPYLKYYNGIILTEVFILNTDRIILGDTVSNIQLRVKYSNKSEYKMVCPYRIIDEHYPLVDEITETEEEKLYRENNELKLHLSQLQTAFTEIRNENVELRDTIKIIEGSYYEQNQLLIIVDNELINKTNKYNRLKAQYQNKLYETGINNMRLVSKIRKIYECENIEEDCPVCYNKLDSKTLVMPICGHSICNSCIGNCNSTCPICRENYHGIDSLFKV